MERVMFIEVLVRLQYTYFIKILKGYTIVVIAPLKKELV